MKFALRIFTAIFTACVLTVCAAIGDDVLRDKTGKTIASIRVNSNGEREIRTAGGVLLGKYRPQDNTTRKPSGELVGKGDLLTTLIPR